MNSASALYTKAKGLLLNSSVLLRGRVQINQLAGEKRKRPQDDEDGNEDDVELQQDQALSEAANDRVMTDLPETAGHGDSNHGNDMIEESTSPSVDFESETISPETRQRAPLIRSYHFRELEWLEGFSFAEQMDRTAYRHGYRQYHDWQPRPARASTPRKQIKGIPKVAIRDSGDEEAVPGTDAPYMDEYEELTEQEQLHHPQTPVSKQFGLATPQTERRWSPGWLETTPSQLGVPLPNAIGPDVLPVWRDSIIEAYDDDDLPRRTNINLSKITSSPMVECETNNVRLKNVDGLRARLLRDIEAEGLAGRRIKYRRLDGPALDWSMMQEEV